MSDAELAYWRTLAEERGRALEELHARLRNVMAALPNAHFVGFAAALEGHGAGWMQEPDRMAPLAQLVPTDVLTALGELWNRVESDGGR